MPQPHNRLRVRVADGPSAPSHRRRLLLLLPVLAVGLSGCDLVGSGGADGPSGEAARTSEGRTVDKAAQTDAEPVRTRTRHLPEDAAYLWWSGTLGSDAPGSAGYWVDAIVTLSPAQAQELRALCTPDGAPVPGTPEAVPELLAELTDEDFSECPGIADHVRAEGWSPRAWISAASPVVVLTLQGEG